MLVNVKLFKNWMHRWVQWYYSPLIFKLEERETRHRLGIWTKSIFLHQTPYPRDIVDGQKKTNSLPLPLKLLGQSNIFPVCSDASVFQNFLSEFSLSAHFLVSCWECFPLTKVNKFLSVNVQISLLSTSSKTVNWYRFKLPDTTSARRGWNGWIHE